MLTLEEAERRIRKLEVFRDSQAKRTRYLNELTAFNASDVLVGLGIGIKAGSNITLTKSGPLIVIGSGAGAGAHALTDANNTVSGRTAGDLLIATAATTYGFAAMSGDATINSAGVVTVPHVLDAAAAHAASAVSNTPAGTVAATTVQAAIDELATDYASADSTHVAAADPHTVYALESALTNGKIRAITFVVDGGGSAITTGLKGDLEIPFACTINAATLLADQSGSIVWDLWKDVYSSYPPTIADTIVAAAKPTISAAAKSQDTTLTGWSTAIAAGDTLRFNIDSCSTITRCTLSLKVTEG